MSDAPVDKTAVAEAVEDMFQHGPAVVKETRAGYKTTEFWLAIAGVLATQLGALDLPGEYGTTITTVALAVAYIVSRGVAKAGTPNVTVPPTS